MKIAGKISIPMRKNDRSLVSIGRDPAGTGIRWFGKGRPQHVSITRSKDRSVKRHVIVHSPVAIIAGQSGYTIGIHNVVVELYAIQALKNSVRSVCGWVMMINVIPR